jgi:hypothetical protein
MPVCHNRFDVCILRKLLQCIGFGLVLDVLGWQWFRGVARLAVSRRMDRIAWIAPLDRIALL